MLLCQKRRVLPPLTKEEINYILNLQIHIPSIKNGDVIVQSCQFPSDYEEENSGKEEVVLEPLVDTNLLQGLENEISFDEKDFAADPIDMDTYAVENIMGDPFANLLQPYGNNAYSSPFIDSQKAMLHNFQDPLDSLLQALEKIYVVLFISINLGFNFHCELPTYTSFYLLEVSERRITVSNHLLDWLHWKDHFTQSAMVEEGKKVKEYANVLPLAHEEETIQLDSCSDLFVDHQDLSSAHAFKILSPVCCSHQIVMVIFVC